MTSTCQSADVTSKVASSTDPIIKGGVPPPASKMAQASKQLSSFSNGKPLFSNGKPLSGTSVPRYHRINRVASKAKSIAWGVLIEEDRNSSEPSPIQVSPDPSSEHRPQNRLNEGLPTCYSPLRFASSNGSPCDRMGCPGTFRSFHGH